MNTTVLTGMVEFIQSNDNNESAISYLYPLFQTYIDILFNKIL